MPNVETLDITDPPYDSGRHCPWSLLGSYFGIEIVPANPNTGDEVDYAARVVRTASMLDSGQIEIAIGPNGKPTPMPLVHDIASLVINHNGSSAAVLSGTEGFDNLDPLTRQAAMRLLQACEILLENPDLTQSLVESRELPE